MKKIKENLNGLGLVKLIVYLFFILFLLIQLFAIFMVSFTYDPINVFCLYISIDYLQTMLSQLQHANLDNFKVIFSNNTYVSSLKNSIYLSVVISVLVLLICIPIAYRIARTKMPFKKTISALCTIPLVIPTFISGYAFIIMFGRSGWATYIYQYLGGNGLLIDPYSMTGIAILQIFFFFH